MRDNVTLARILGGNIETALDRVAREQELRSRERHLAERKERLETITDVVSHDLRNPVSAAEGYVDRARQEAGDLEALARMDALIEHVLTVASHDDVIEETEHVALETVATDAWATTDTKDATLEMGESTDLDVDRSRTQQLFETLFRTVVEHADSDVTITVGTFEDGFYVADDGQGGPDAERDDAFEPGFSANTDETGVRFSIVKRIADAHNWGIRLSESDTGGVRIEITEVEFAGR